MSKIANLRPMSEAPNCAVGINANQACVVIFDENSQKVGWLTGQDIMAAVAAYSDDPWHQMDSAPKDGTLIDVFVSHDIGAIAPADYRVPNVKWDESLGWVYKFGDYVKPLKNEWMDPIRWMPRPDEPVWKKGK